MTKPITDKQTVGIMLVLASTIAFAIGPTAAKLALDDGSNTLTVVTLRGVVGAMLMALLIAMSRQGFGINRRALLRCLYCSVCYGLTIYGFIGSIASVPVNVSVLVFFTHPILVAVIVHFRGGDRLTAGKLLLACAALAGLGLALGPGLVTLDPTGIALAAFAAVAMCGMILCSAQAQEHATSAQVNLYATTISSVAFAVLTSILGAWAMPLNLIGWLGIIGAGIGIGIGLLTLFAALRYLSPVRVTMLSNIEPLISILLAIVILGERIGPPQCAGIVLVIGALVLFETVGRGHRVGEQDNDVKILT